MSFFEGTWHVARFLCHCWLRDSRYVSSVFFMKAITHSMWVLVQKSITEHIILWR